MKAVIWKYVLVPGSNVLILPRTSRALSVGWQDEDLVMWVLLPDPGFTHQLFERSFLAVVTGEEFDRLNTDEYVGTAMYGSEGGLTAHVFEVKS